MARKLRVRLLLDTHVLLWWLNDSDLGETARDAIADPDNEVFVSAASAWEIAIKQALGKLRGPIDLRAEISANGFQSLPITIEHGLTAGALPRHHEDPFDRMLIAQAQLHAMTAVTRDDRFPLYDLELLRG